MSLTKILFAKPAKLINTTQSISNETFDEFFFHWWVEFSKIWNRENEIQLIKQHLTNDNILNLIDVGCADMYLFSRGYLPELKNLYGVEPNIHLFEEAKNNNPFAKLYNAYGDNLPFQNDYADLILCLWVLHLVDDIPSIIRELKRVGKPHSTLLITVPEIDSQLYAVFYDLSRALFPSISILNPNQIIEDVQQKIFEQFSLDEVEKHLFYGKLSLPSDQDAKIAPIAVFVHWFLKEHFTLSQIFKTLKDNSELLNNLPTELSDKGIFINVKLSNK